MFHINERLYNFRAVLRSFKSKTDFDSAINFCEVRLDTDGPYIHHHLALLYHTGLGDPKNVDKFKADRHYADALKKDKSCPHVWHDVGVLYKDGPELCEDLQDQRGMVMWTYEESAFLKYGVAMYALYDMYSSGNLLLKDEKWAKYWLNKFYTKSSLDDIISTIDGVDDKSYNSKDYTEVITMSKLALRMLKANIKHGIPERRKIYNRSLKKIGKSLLYRTVYKLSSYSKRMLKQDIKRQKEYIKRRKELEKRIFTLVQNRRIAFMSEKTQNCKKYSDITIMCIEF